MLNLPLSYPISTLIPAVLQRIDHLSDRLGLSVPPIVDFNQIKDLPAGTLGHGLVEHLQEHHLEPFTSGPRRKQLHDLVHVLAGYGTDLVGELEVQAFLLGCKVHLAQIVFTVGILRLLLCHSMPQLDRSIWERFWTAYQRGQHSQFDIDLWCPETEWHLPLQQIQAKWGLTT
jgi:ubiquinone biosynthesis protein Coq4